MAVASATICSIGIGSQKNTKNWREAMKYLRRVDRARFLRRDGSDLTCNWEALRQEMEKVNACQRQQMEIAVGCCTCGVAYPSCLQCGGKHKARRQRQRAKRKRLRDEQTVSRMLVRSLSLF